MKKLSLNDYIKLRRLVFRGATPLLFALWRCAFENGDPDDVLSVLECYQNEDGGFGNALEANCWNPNSSPYVTGFAVQILEGLFGFKYEFIDRSHPVLRGILKYFASGEYATENGWLGISDIPSNNDYSHAPWFRFDPAAAEGETDPEKIVGFVLKYGDAENDLYKKALRINEKPPKEKPEPDFANYNPTEFICWEPLPTDFADSPESPHYENIKFSLRRSSTDSSKGCARRRNCPSRASTIRRAGSITGKSSAVILRPADFLLCKSSC